MLNLKKRFSEYHQGNVFLLSIVSSVSILLFSL